MHPRISSSPKLSGKKFRKKRRLLHLDRSPLSRFLLYCLVLLHFLTLLLRFLKLLPHILTLLLQCPALLHTSPLVLLIIPPSSHKSSKTSPSNLSDGETKVVSSKINWHGRVEQRLGGLKTNTILDTSWCRTYQERIRPKKKKNCRHSFLIKEFENFDA